MPWKALYFILLLRVTDAGVLMIFFFIICKSDNMYFFPQGNDFCFSARTPV